ncbi:Glyco hydro 20 domain containing protein [Asbolus verrucosus]|uniref:beta-N-acetylhexosaminidase n=1 Tax=Asbolus verrucosus TaxID=1661398 RepID=A0A482VMN4_ASBVE|nr:Glyco hydro 20 domain containing protein [Asbolus verrucosus]
MLTLLIVAIVAVCDADLGPDVIATKGEVWPKPQRQEKSQNYFIVQPQTFNFMPPDNVGCPSFLRGALTRYSNIIANQQPVKPRKRSWKVGDNFAGFLEILNIELEEECPDEDVLPGFGDVEEYTLTVTATEGTLSAPTIWGVLRGLETFSQLIYLEEDTLLINATTIHDFPRFPHRGLLIDTSRHFEPVEVILQHLDAMAYNKLNVFHWHITDDHSFPYKSRTYPELSNQGAYHPVAKIYNQEDVKRVIEHARLRGIRVIPEFDTPAHTRSWGVAYPELLTTCYENGAPTGELGPMDPSKDSTYDFLTNLFTEVTKAGKFALLSSCWYLSELVDGPDWNIFYKCEPLDFDGSDEQKKLVLGGEACMWGEYVNQYNIIPKVWPGASAVAERLWSNVNVSNFTDAQKRIEEHACRMNRRGIGALPPNGPGFCL